MTEKTSIILPSLIAVAQAELEERTKRVKDASDHFHLDVMDGGFVPTQSLWFNFSRPIEKFCEAHLMVEDPVAWVKEHGMKVDRIIAPIEATKDVEGFISLVKGMGKEVGFAINPKTPVSAVADYLDKIDEIIVMTVEPGFYGSPFVASCLEKVKEIRKLAPDLHIEADGSMKPETIGLAKEAGANLFVVGSYLQKAEDVSDAVGKLKGALGE